MMEKSCQTRFNRGQRTSQKTRASSSSSSTATSRAPRASPRNAGLRSTCSKPPRPLRSSSMCLASPRTRFASRSAAARCSSSAPSCPRRLTRRAIPSGGTQLRPVRARRADHRRVRCEPRDRARVSAASCASCCRASRSAAAQVVVIAVRTRMTRLLFIGDIVGKPGRELVRRGLAALVAHHRIDLVIANGENAAAGFGITPDIADDSLCLRRPRDDRRQSHLGQEGDPPLLRRAAAAAAAGELSRGHARARASYVAQATNGVPVAVINVMGRVFMTAIDDPFRVVLDEIDGRQERGARSSSWTFTPKRRPKRSRWAGISTAASRPSSARTRTSQTADERVLPQGTAYITDVGMTGPHDSVIGVDESAILQRFLTGAAAAIRDGHREPAPERRHRRRRRSHRPRQRDRARSASPRRTSRRSSRSPLRRADRMDDWLDLPFDDDASTEEPPATTPPLSVSELTARLKSTVEAHVHRAGRRGRDLQLPAVELGPRVLHAEGRPRADSRGDVPHDRAAAEVPARRRHARRRPRPAQRLRGQGRVPARSATRSSRTGSARCRRRSSSSSAGCRPKGCSTPHASGRCRAAAPHRRRHVARRRGRPRHSARLCHRAIPTARVVMRAARVQGDGAAEDLIRALRAIVRVAEVDVVIIGRGGGSAEDLWAFNDEALARAIAACPVPVISAVGHEVDFTIADFVADVRAATPSNAAELVVDRADNFRARIDRAERAPACRRCASAPSAGGSSADRLDMRLEQWPVRVVMRDRDRQELDAALSHAMRDRARTAGAAVRRAAAAARAPRRAARDRGSARRASSRADGRLRELVTARRLAWQSRVGALAARLDALSPLAVLGRGYAVCWNEDADEYHSIGPRRRPRRRACASRSPRASWPAGSKTPTPLRHEHRSRTSNRPSPSSRKSSSSSRKATCRSTSRSRSSSAASSSRATATSSSAPRERRIEHAHRTRRAARTPRIC